MKRIALALVLGALPVTAALAGEIPDLKKEAVGVIKGFGGGLLKELKSAMNESGPVEAIGSCNLSAPAITADANEGAWEVGRTSLKLRNPGNEPDAWEKAVLMEFDARRAKGEDPMKIAKAEVVEMEGKKVFRLMKAIPTAELCLNCHGGAEVKPEVEAKLKELYPDDKARGYSVGQIRGAFTLKKPL